MIAAGRRVRDETLGDAQKRAMQKVFEDATSVVLVEMARHDQNDRNLPDRLAAEFGKFYGDSWVAEMLVGVALSKEEPPFEKLRRRFSEVDADAEALPMNFEAALEILVYELADRLRKEASRAGSPLANLVQLSELETIRGKLEELVRGLKKDGGDADESVSGPDPIDPRFTEYERGPDGASFDVLFAGFFLPSGSEGRFTSGGASRAVEREFLEIFRRELDDHRLNTSGIEVEGATLSARILDHRPPAGYVGAHDHESFSNITKRLAERTLGVVWGTIREGGGLGTLEVVVNPDRFYGGPAALETFSSVKRLADREDLTTTTKMSFAARALAAMWAQSFCAQLDHCRNHVASYVVASDSRHLLERALEDLGRELDVCCVD